MKFHKKIIAYSALVTLLGCTEEKRQERLSTIAGIPELSAYSEDIHHQSISFVLNRQNENEIICCFDGWNQVGNINPMAAAIIDAYSDKQEISVYGRFNRNKMAIYSINHPDLGTFRIDDPSAFSDRCFE